LGEKIQSPLRAKFRTLAEKNGYPGFLAQAMVTADIGVVVADSSVAEESNAKTARARTDSGKSAGREYFTVKQWDALGEKGQAKYKSHKVLVPEGQLLTLTDKEALAYGFSTGSYASLQEFLDRKGWTKTEEIPTSWSEDLARAIGAISPILMMLGLGALYLEFKTPGLSIFGLIGALCLAIVFGGKYAVGLADHTELLLLLAGFAFVMVEIYLFPGTLIAGVTGLCLILVALTLSLQTFTLPDPEMPWEMKSLIDNVFTTLGSAVVAILIPLTVIRFVLPRLPAGASVIAQTTLAGAHAQVPEAGRFAVGAVGVSKTPLRPYGKAVFGGETVEVSSRGDFIEAGSPIEVARIDGNTILVRLSGAPTGNPA
ncbi:MAG: NfeD family protein, partial [Fibrobacteria bacterium]